MMKGKMFRAVHIAKIVYVNTIFSLSQISMNVPMELPTVMRMPDASILQAATAVSAMMVSLEMDSLAQQNRANSH